MNLASIIDQYYDGFMVKYNDKVLPTHLKALNGIRRCHTPDACQIQVQCAPNADRSNGTLCPAGTAVAPNAKTMKPANGLTGN